MAKTCTRCNKVKESEDFYNCKNTKDGLTFSCIECEKLRRKTLDKAKQKEYKKKSRLKLRYNLSLELYNSLLKEQNHKCAVCGLDEKEAYKETLVVDHCHTTGRVRGLLCHNCNLALGHSKDSIDVLLKLIQYLNKE